MDNVQHNASVTGACYDSLYIKIHRWEIGNTGYCCGIKEDTWWTLRKIKDMHDEIFMGNSYSLTIS
jgi:hypothetical protein